MNIHIVSVSNEEIKLRHGFTGADWWFDYEFHCDACGRAHVDRSNFTRLCPDCEQPMPYRIHIEVRVAKELEDWRERMALAIHEATEALMCLHLGITVEQVDKFDEKFQQANDNDTNAGDEPDAPYRVPHNYATAIERVLAGVLEIDWRAYDERLGKL